MTLAESVNQEELTQERKKKVSKSWKLRDAFMSLCDVREVGHRLQLDEHGNHLTSVQTWNTIKQYLLHIGSGPE